MYCELRDPNVIVQKIDDIGFNPTTHASCINKFIWGVPADAAHIPRPFTEFHMIFKS